MNLLLLLPILAMTTNIIKCDYQTLIIPDDLINEFVNETQFARSLKILYQPTTNNTQTTGIFHFSNYSRTFSYYQSNSSNNTNTHENRLEDLAQKLIAICFIRKEIFEQRNTIIPNSCNDHLYVKLTVLDFSSNQLTVYPFQLLDEWFPNLDELNLAENLITFINGDLNFAEQLSRTSLKILDLSRNLIEAMLDERSFGQLTSLRHLNLRGNRIKNIDLYGQYRLVHLDLSENQIYGESVENWPMSIEFINVSHNSIEVFSWEKLSKAKNLSHVVLNHNRLMDFELFLSSWSKFSEIQMIEIEFNLFESLSNLTNLNLTICNTKSGRNFTELRLYGNPLVCDCDENKWWYQIVDSTSPISLFQFNNQNCIRITDYNSLNCSKSNSTSIYAPISRQNISPNIGCTSEISTNSILTDYYKTILIASIIFAILAFLIFVTFVLFMKCLVPYRLKKAKRDKTNSPPLNLSAAQDAITIAEVSV